MTVITKRKSLRQKFYVIFLLICFFLLCLFFIYFIILYSNILKYEQEKINLYIKSASVNINNDIVEIIDDIKSFIKSKEFIEFDREKSDNCLSHFISKKYIDSILITDKYGNIIISSGKNVEFLKNNLTDYNFFKLSITEKKEIITENIINDQLLTTISLPILKNDNVIGLFIAVLNFYVKDIDILNNLIDPGSYKWEVLLTNKKGYIIYHSHIDVSKLKIEELNFSEYPTVKNALIGKTGLSRININNEYWYTGSDYIPTCAWIVIVQVPSNIIIQKVFKIIFPSLISLIIVILIILGLIYFSSYFVIYPLVSLTNAIKSYGETGQTNQLIIQGDDEISDAMKTFNKMIIDKTKMDREILEFIEKDRKRTGRALHNELEDYLNSIYKNILVLKEELNKIANKENQYILLNINKIENLLNFTINKTKLISNGLYPISIEKGIYSSIVDFIKDIEYTFKININFYFDKDIIIVNEQIALNIYYIIQEAINISVKYNNSKMINISMKYVTNNIEIKISDDGNTFTEDDNKKMAIRIMNYIAKLINGDINIENTNKGSEITCIIKITMMS